MLTDLYRPNTISDLVGNQGSINSLFQWLKDWDDVQVRGNKKAIPKPSGFNPRAWASAPKLNAKAALLSGPPGIGKTSSVRIVCMHLGFEVLEMNASDCRSKLAIQSSVSTIAGNKSIDYWTTAGQAKQKTNAENAL